MKYGVVTKSEDDDFKKYMKWSKKRPEYKSVFISMAFDEQRHATWFRKMSLGLLPDIPQIKVIKRPMKPNSRTDLAVMMKEEIDTGDTYLAKSKSYKRTDPKRDIYRSMAYDEYKHAKYLKTMRSGKDIKIIRSNPDMGVGILVLSGVVSILATLIASAIIGTHIKKHKGESIFARIDGKIRKNPLPNPPRWQVTGGFGRLEATAGARKVVVTKRKGCPYKFVFSKNGKKLMEMKTTDTENVMDKTINILGQEPSGLFYSIEHYKDMRGNPGIPTKEFWQDVYPDVYDYYRNDKGHSKNEAEKIAKAVTGSIWHKKIKPGTKAKYEKKREDREENPPIMVSLVRRLTNGPIAGDVMVSTEVLVDDECKACHKRGKSGHVCVCGEKKPDKFYTVTEWDVRLFPANIMKELQNAGFDHLVTTRHHANKLITGAEPRNGVVRNGTVIGLKDELFYPNIDKILGLLSVQSISAISLHKKTVKLGTVDGSILYLNTQSTPFLKNKKLYSSKDNYKLTYDAKIVDKNYRNRVLPGRICEIELRIEDHNTGRVTGNLSHSYTSAEAWPSHSTIFKHFDNWNLNVYTSSTSASTTIPAQTPPAQTPPAQTPPAQTPPAQVKPSQPINIERMRKRRMQQWNPGVQHGEVSLVSTIVLEDTTGKHNKFYTVTMWDIRMFQTNTMKSLKNAGYGYLVTSRHGPNKDVVGIYPGEADSAPGKSDVGVKDELFWPNIDKILDLLTDKINSEVPEHNQNIRLGAIDGTTLYLNTASSWQSIVDKKLGKYHLNYNARIIDPNYRFSISATNQPTRTKPLIGIEVDSETTIWGTQVKRKAQKTFSAKDTWPSNSSIFSYLDNWKQNVYNSTSASTTIPAQTPPAQTAQTPPAQVKPSQPINIERMRKRRMQQWNPGVQHGEIIKVFEPRKYTTGIKSMVKISTDRGVFTALLPAGQSTGPITFNGIINNGWIGQLKIVKTNPYTFSPGEGRSLTEEEISDLEDKSRIIVFRGDYADINHEFNRFRKRETMDEDDERMVSIWFLTSSGWFEVESKSIPSGLFNEHLNIQDLIGIMDGKISNSDPPLFEILEEDISMVMADLEPGGEIYLMLVGHEEENEEMEEDEDEGYDLEEEQFFDRLRKNFNVGDRFMGRKTYVFEDDEKNPIFTVNEGDEAEIVSKEKYDDKVDIFEFKMPDGNIRKIYSDEIYKAFKPITTVKADIKRLRARRKRWNPEGE